MLRSVTIHKALGQTPLEAVKAWRRAHPAYQDVPLSYAGRLDPMAEGKLLVLIGDECKRQAAYTGLDKEYEIEVLLGVSSDTGDVLGITSAHVLPAVTQETVQRALRSVTGTHRVPYPAYSSKTVGGVPLFLHALQGTLGTIKIPEHDETVHRISLCGVSFLSPEALAARVGEMLAHAPVSDAPSKTLGADFRIREVRAGWGQVQAALGVDVPVLSLRVTASSGTYMRTLAARLAHELGTGGLALSIRRTKIGRYVSLPGGFGLWVRSY